MGLLMRRSMSTLRWLSTVGLLLAVVGVATPAQAQRQLDEYDVKGAFLYKLIKFVEWPPSARGSGTVVIGVFGRDAFDDVLGVVTKAKKGGPREVEVRQLSQVKDVRGCHIVFIAESEARRTLDILREVGNAGILTVGETPSFLRDGGVVRFYVEGNRVRFQIDSVAAQVSGLKISAQLLSLAK